MMRFRVEPRDVPPEMAARRLGLNLAELGAEPAWDATPADPDVDDLGLQPIDRRCESYGVIAMEVA